MSFTSSQLENMRLEDREIPIIVFRLCRDYDQDDYKTMCNLVIKNRHKFKSMFDKVDILSISTEDVIAETYRLFVDDIAQENGFFYTNNMQRRQDFNDKVYQILQTIEKIQHEKNCS
jgi:methionine synthase I (cobalamin-dependent)